MRNLRLGVPSKGRLSEIAGSLLKQAGLSYRRQERSLFARVREVPVDVTFLRTDDIPVLCAEGAIDMGITGSDLVAENLVDVQTRLELGMGQCRLSICVPETSRFESVKDLAGCRVATTFPNVTQAYLEPHHVPVHLVRLSGSVEIMVALGVADAVVDLVETGSTLAANQLRIMEDIGKYQTVLIQRSGFADDESHLPALADRVVRRLEGAIIARAYSLLEYNIPRDRLHEAEAIPPGFKSPTVNSLEDEAWCAVQVMVPRKDVITKMEQLEAIGASAILETNINNCRL